jgi:hypothetical protein
VSAATPKSDRHQPDDRSDDFLEWRRGFDRHHLGRPHVPYQVVRWVLPRVHPRAPEDRLLACAVGPMVTLVVLPSLEDSWRRRQSGPQRCERRHARQDVMFTEE